ncbi:Adenylate cyclase [Streptococcus sp. DD10]|nr:Adenylate cyclase [Streptococcus sp. DD10]
MEYNLPLNLNEAEAILQGAPFFDCHITQLLRENDISPKQLILLGSLTTLRYEMKHKIGLLALDKNHYFDNTDYELEVEVENPQKGETDFFDFLAEQDIEYRFAKSKIARFAQKLPNS